MSASEFSDFLEREAEHFEAQVALEAREPMRWFYDAMETSAKRAKWEASFDTDCIREPRL